MIVLIPGNVEKTKHVGTAALAYPSEAEGAVRRPQGDFSPRLLT